MKVTITGDNSFALSAELKKLIKDFLDEYGDMALERIDAEDADFDRIREALQSLPFLAAKKMVIIRNPGSNKQFVEAADKLLSELPDTTDVILVEPKFDKRSGYYKLLKKVTDFREYSELDINSMTKWLSMVAKEQEGHLSQSDATYLIERVGANQQLLSNELEKLLLYNKNISRETINILTELTPQSTVFELFDTAFNGDPKRTIELYKEQRRLKMEPQKIIAMLAWQLHVLALIKTAGERTPQEVAIAAKLNPFVASKSSGIAKYLTLAKLKKLIADLLVIDIRLKQDSTNADEALQNYLLAIAN